MCVCIIKGFDRIKNSDKLYLGRRSGLAGAEVVKLPLHWQLLVSPPLRGYVEGTRADIGISVSPDPIRALIDFRHVYIV